ncbi:MAG: replication initiation factor domain-containing protein [Ignavibacteria bacterium]|nr:replication initiation factor domain-containing protein [Ignavibacteria bacterium]
MDDVLGAVFAEVGESVVVLDRGMFGYREGFAVGPVRVYHHSEKPEMGVCVEVSGSACEELGMVALGRLFVGLELRASRLDIALDHCGFTPAQLREEWIRGNVRTLCKVPEGAREDRQWRTCSWDQNAQGDTFSMGSRTSGQFARCYDQRGFTRLELELKGRTAEASALPFFVAVGTADEGTVRCTALALVRRFVDFVDASSDENASRRSLLPFWEAFCGSVERARVRLEGQVVATLEEAAGWLRRSVSRTLAVFVDAYGDSGLRELVDHGRSGWGSRHRAMLRDWRTITVAVPT